MNADSIKIEYDENGFYMVVEGDLSPEFEFARSFTFHVKDPQALYDTVKREIGPWLYERDMAKATRPHYTMPASGLFAYDPDGGYCRDDPKHENYHSVHADIYDNREGK